MDWLDKSILFLIGCYCFVFSVISVNRFWQYEAHYMDFGIYDEAIWKVAHFKPPIVDKGENGKIIFADHFAPGMFLLSPLYWFTDRQEIMFIAQVLAIGISAWVAYRIARYRRTNTVMIIALVFAYLGFIGMQNALITELHEIVFAVLPLILMFWAIEKKRWNYFFLFMMFLLSLKESNAGLVVGLGLYLLVRYQKQYIKYATLTIFIGICWGIATTMIIIPAFNQGVYAYAPSHLKGLNIFEIVAKLFDEKIKRDTILATFSTFGFLPLFDISTWPMVLEHYFERFVLSTDRTRFDLGFHYNSILVPILFMSTLNVLDSFKKRVPNKLISLYAIGILCWVIYFSRFIYHGPIDLFYNRAFYEQRKNLSYIDDFVTLFPKKGVVLTQNNLAPRLTHGPDIRIIRSNFIPLHPDYVILDITPGQRFVGTDDLAIRIKEYYEANTEYSLTKMHSDQYLFQKKGMGF